jgi:hypothetical protein
LGICGSWRVWETPQLHDLLRQVDGRAIEHPSVQLKPVEGTAPPIVLAPRYGDALAEDSNCSIAGVDVVNHIFIVAGLFTPYIRIFFLGLHQVGEPGP